MRTTAPCRDAGAQHADQDPTDARAYAPGEVSDLRFDQALPVRHPDSRHADVLANGGRLTIRARHEVLAHYGRTLIAFGQVFEVERRCIRTVWP